MSSPFINKLKREVQKSPGKAATLALLLCVALWFWAPLLTGMLGSSPNASAVPSATTNQTAASNTSNNTAAALPPAAATVPWRELAKTIEHDPLMQPARVTDRPRDVFQPVQPSNPVEDELAQSTEPTLKPELDVPPQSVGLALTSTIVGPRRYVARINGANYRPADIVEVASDQGKLSYVLTQVTDRSVTLSLGNKQYELNMPRRAASATSQTANFISSDDPNFDPSILE
jgi:hypothetical protein